MGPQLDGVGNRGLERLLEDVSFDAGTANTQIEINAAYVEEHLGELAKNEDLSRYIL